MVFCLAPMQSYSQHGQDTFVYEAFFKGRTEPGTFVDVGAYDGVTFSNTLLFERLGWMGVCVEPLPPAFSKLRSSRKAICVNCAVADRAGEAMFVEAEMPAPFEQMYSGLKANLDDYHTRLIREHSRNVKQYRGARKDPPGHLGRGRNPAYRLSFGRHRRLRVENSP